MGKFIDLTDKVFGKLTVLRYTTDINNKRKWECICSCPLNKKVLVDTGSLNNGDRKSCGCLYKENHYKTHNASNTSEYEIWASIKKRCTNRKCKAYPRYGGRGIKMCERWFNSFEIFLSDVGYRPSALHSLDRFPNNDGDYEPNNFRWATEYQQSRNRRDNVWIEYDDRKQVLEDWAKEVNKSAKEISRYMKKGYSFKWCIDNINKDYKSGMSTRKKKAA